MLVPAMTQLEISIEFHRDLEKVDKSINTRMLHEYDRERKKMKIDKSKEYPRNYTIKMKSKNNWIVFFKKRPSVSRYHNEEDIMVYTVTYYYNEFGLRAFRFGENYCLEAFNAHFFKRYNERLQLNLPNSLSVMQHFFTNNSFVKAEIIEKDNEKVTVSICKDGLALGKFCKHNYWIIHNTFISHDLKRPKQVELEKQMVEMIEKNIVEKELSDCNLDEDYNYYISTEIMAQLKKVS